jgi:Holliday junction resolvase RusA-like endonuclease
MMIEFYVNGTPKGQPRPKAFARKFGAKWMARVYDPGTAEGWKSEIATAAKTHIPPQPLSGPLSVQIALHFPRPKSHSNKKGTLKADAPRFHTSKPDSDNAAKACLDALTALGFWLDDSQVCKLQCWKFYTTDGRPGAWIRIGQAMEA